MCQPTCLPACLPACLSVCLPRKKTVPDMPASGEACVLIVCGTKTVLLFAFAVLEVAIRMGLKDHVIQVCFFGHRRNYKIDRYKQV